MLKYAEIIVKVEKKRIQSLNTLYTGLADGFSYGQSFELCRGCTEQRSGLRYVATHGPIPWHYVGTSMGETSPDHHGLTYYPYNNSSRSSTKILGLYIQLYTPNSMDYLWWHEDSYPNPSPNQGYPIILRGICRVLIYTHRALPGLSPR